MINWNEQVKSRGYDDIRSFIETEYIGNGIGLKSAADLIGVSHASFRNKVVSLGYPRRSRGGANYKKKACEPETLHIRTGRKCWCGEDTAPGNWFFCKNHFDQINQEPTPEETYIIGVEYAY